MKNTDFNLKTKNDHDVKSEFLSIVKHEFSTPMVIIQGYCEMLIDLLPTSNLTQDQIECIQNISNSVKHLEKTMDEILDIYLLESNQVTFSKDNISIHDLMMKIMDSFADLAKQNKISMTNLTTINSCITSDKKRIMQVFHNLIKNSLSFVSPNSGKIELGATLNKNMIVFFVKDNGSGIPKEKTEYIFQKFFQVDSTYRREHFGIGLGLAISKRIIEHLGGQIWVKSIENVGTTIYFSIPVETRDMTIT